MKKKTKASFKKTSSKIRFSTKTKVRPDLKKSFHSLRRVEKRNKKGVLDGRNSQNIQIINDTRQSSLPVVPSIINRSFDLLHRLSVCTARQLRRRAIFAGGKSGGKHKKPHYTEESNIKC